MREIDAQTEKITELPPHGNTSPTTYVFHIRPPNQPSIQPTIHPTIHPSTSHDDVIKWKHFPRCSPFVRGIHRSPVNSPRKGQWRGALMCSLICAWINAWINNCRAGDLRRHHTHYDVTVMPCLKVYTQARSGASKAHHLTCFTMIPLSIQARLLNS